MEFVCYTDWQQLPESANSLFDQGAQQSLYLSRAWFESLTSFALDENHTLLLACVIEQDQVLACLPLVKISEDTVTALRHNYTPLYSVLLIPHQQALILDCLAQGLAQSPVINLRLDPVAQDDVQLNQLQHALQSKGFACHHAFRFYNWFHHVAGQSFIEYMADRPARLRNTIARKQRKLEREHGYRIQLYTGDKVEAAMADYNAIYQASWKANEQFGDLLNDLAVRLARQDWTRLAILYIADKPAAAQLWFVTHGKANIFRLAYDETWKAYSPGSILTHYLMRHVIDIDRVEEIDYLVGNEQYKQDWMSERRERWGLYSGAQKADKTNREIRITRIFEGISSFWRQFRRR